MVSKYAQQLSNYAKTASAKSFVKFDKALNSIFIGKNETSIVIKPIGDGFIPVPIHSWVSAPDGGPNAPHNDFVCRSLIEKPCYICDMLPNKFDPSKPNRPSTRYLTLAMRLSWENGQAKVEYRDCYVSKKFGEKLLKTKLFEGAKYEIVDDRMQFLHLPSIGLFSTTKSVNAAFGAYQMDDDLSFNDIYRITKTGEGKDTRYVTVNKGKGTDYSKKRPFLQALALHMTIDDYIDSHISRDWYNENLNLSIDDGTDDDPVGFEEDMDNTPDDDMGDDMGDDIEDDAPKTPANKAAKAPKASTKKADESDSPDDLDDMDDEFEGDDEMEEDRKLTPEEYEAMIKSKFGVNSSKD